MKNNIFVIVLLFLIYGCSVCTHSIQSNADTAFSKLDKEQSNQLK